MDLSILIPARNEEFLRHTIEDILRNREADTEVIALLDGKEADPPIVPNERVHIIRVHEAVGQRAGTNLACKLSSAKYVMKVDAHCAFDKGFDRKMINKFKETGDDVTMIPIMHNLHAFDWLCKDCEWTTYQDRGPFECEECKSKNLTKKMIWKPRKDRSGRRNPASTSYLFNSTPQFKYFEDYKHRDQYKKDRKEKGVTESMSIQGSCFMLTRENYWRLNICDEKLGNWGNQGIEVACKTWLSGGKVLINHDTWYAHMFRTKSNFSFPWPASGRDQLLVKKRIWHQILKGRLVDQKHKPSWLVEKFWPVPGWDKESLEKLKKDER